MFDNNKKNISTLINGGQGQGRVHPTPNAHLNEPQQNQKTSLQSSSGSEELNSNR